MRKRWARLLPGDEADLLDPDREEHARRTGAPSRPRSPPRRLLGGDLPEALELHQLLRGEPVEVGRRHARARVLQHRDLLLAQAVDVHRAARDEVLEQLPTARPGSRGSGTS